jgi:hypothetical protein
MEKIKFTKDDKQYLLDRGFPVKDIKQIERLKYRITNDKQDISFDEACALLGRKQVLAAIGRAAFHSSGSIGDANAYLTGWSVISNLFPWNK